MQIKSVLISLLGTGLIMFWGGPTVARAADNHHHEGDHPHEAEAAHHHVAHHGGVLNVIGKCEMGHIEVRLLEDTLEAWFVGGGHDTDRAVQVKAEEIPLQVKLPNAEEKALVLAADPMTLAGEKPGHCSRFIAQAEWLKGVEEFEARGTVVFKGLPQELFIRYPGGYDPEHAHHQGDHH